MKTVRLLLFAAVVVSVNAGFLDSLRGFFGGNSKNNQPSLKPVNDNQARTYLQNFGYVPASGLNSAPGMSGDFTSAGDLFKRALMKFQEFAGLSKTGQLDDQTRRKMAEPRCGVVDIQAISASREAAFKWPGSRVTYFIENSSKDLPMASVRKAIGQAYAAWSEKVPLDFEEVSSASDADITIRFGVRNHGDPWPFDGDGGVLAHATMPTSGKLHFDDDESWAYMDARKIESNEYTDILAVAIHESGHTLGLQHSRDENAIMAPFYHKTTDGNGNYIIPRLTSDDIQAIQDIYGPRRGGRPSQPFIPEPTTQAPRTTTKSFLDGFLDRFRGGGSSSNGGDSNSSGGGSSRGRSSSCPNSIDAFTPGENADYVFSGSKVYEIKNRRVVETYSLRQLFPNGPPFVEAAVYNPISGFTILFQGGKSIAEGIPIGLRIPEKATKFNPKGALRWINGHQIIFNGNQFGVYDEYWNQVTLKDKMSNYFPNLPNNVKGAKTGSNGLVILLTESTAYQYDTNRKDLNGESLSVGTYLNC